MTPEAELLRVLQAGDADITRHRAWLDLFLELAQTRIDALRQTLNAWQSQAIDQPLPFAALTQADELAGLCAEQPSDSLVRLSAMLAQALRRASAASTRRSRNASFAKTTVRAISQTGMITATATSKTNTSSNTTAPPAGSQLPSYPKSAKPCKESANPLAETAGHATVSATWRKGATCRRTRSTFCAARWRSVRPSP